MVAFMLFFFGVIGLTHILVDSKVMQPVRTWLAARKFWPLAKAAQVIGCYQCCGFWAGLFVGLLTFSGWEIAVAGFAGSFLANFAALYMNYVEAKTVISLEE